MELNVTEMDKSLKQIVDKLFCMHDWEVMATTEYTDGYRYLLKCKKCGKLVRKWL